MPALTHRQDLHDSIKNRVTGALSTWADVFADWGVCGRALSYLVFVVLPAVAAAAWRWRIRGAPFGAQALVWCTSLPTTPLPIISSFGTRWR